MNAPTPHAGHRAGGTGLVSRRPFVVFVVLACMFSWLVLSPWVLAQNGIGLLSYRLDPRLVPVVLVVATFGPTLAAIVTRRLTGEPRVRPVRRWGRPSAWAVILVALPTAEALGLLSLAGPGEALHTLPAAVIMGAVGVVSGPLGEEPGWRGYAMPVLQRSMAPLPAALLLGLVWAFWHLPQFFTQEWDTPRGSVGDVLGFVAFTIAASVILAWAVNLAGGSVLMAILGHTVINGVPGVINATAHVTLSSIWPAAAGMTALAVVAAVVTRGRLGAIAATTRGAQASAS